MVKPVRFAVPASTAFDYLADPANRPEWQSSLRRVEDVVGEVGVGQSWTDVTVPGLRPRMETTELVRPTRWTERGTWRGIDATLTLTFEPAGDTACDVRASMRLRGWGPLGPVLSVVAPRAVAADLRSAAKILGAG